MTQPRQVITAVPKISHYVYVVPKVVNLGYTPAPYERKP